MCVCAQCNNNFHFSLTRTNRIARTTDRWQSAQQFNNLRKIINRRIQAVALIRLYICLHRKQANFNVYKFCALPQFNNSSFLNIHTHTNTHTHNTKKSQKSTLERKRKKKKNHKYGSLSRVFMYLIIFVLRRAMLPHLGIAAK